MTWTRLALSVSGSTKQQHHIFQLSHDIEGIATCAWGDPRESEELPVIYTTVDVRRCIDQSGQRSDEASVDGMLGLEIKGLFKANPVCIFDGRPFFGRHFVDPKDPTSATWTNEVVVDEAVTEENRRFKLSKALRSIPWAKGKINIDLLPPVFFDADGYTYAVAPPTTPPPHCLQAAILVVEARTISKYANEFVFLLGTGLGLPHMAVRMPIAPRPAE